MNKNYFLKDNKILIKIIYIKSIQKGVNSKVNLRVSLNKKM
jgi:hypothetical protein